MGDIHTFGSCSKNKTNFSTDFLPNPK